MKKILKTILLTSLFMPAIGFSQCVLNASPFYVGEYNPIQATELSASGSISVNCPVTQTVNVSMSGGNSNNIYDRYMLNMNNERVHYNLYLNFSGSAILGDGINGQKYVGNSGTIPVYLKVRALQNVETGLYTDSLIATIDF